ncbi:MAG: hypothetical protein M5U14_22110 [Acidimicrobiia bacterium]|nr:hypothetical protein [Acidimicrobiia bacterium]
MGSVVGAVLGMLVVAFAPGLLLLRALPLRFSAVDRLALAPALSVGLLFVVAEIGSVTGIPFGPAAFLVLVALLVVVWIVASRRRGGRTDHAPVPPVRGPLVTGLVLLGVALGVLVWALGMRGVAVVPPNYDAGNHGFMTARVSETGTIAPDEVLLAGPEGTGLVADYYPLGLHASTAVAYRLSGAEVADVLNAATVLFAAVVFPLGLFALMRRLVPDDPLAGGFAVFLAPLLGMFPYKPIGWGGIALIAGMALVPVTVALLLDVAMMPWARARAGVAALVTFAGFMVHNSQLPLVLVLVGLVLLERAWRSRDPSSLLVALRHLALVGVGVLVLASPILPDLLGGASERIDYDDREPKSLEFFLGSIVGLGVAVPWRQGVLSALTVAGAGVALWQRRLWSWASALVLVVWIGGLSHSSDGWLSQVLGFPWYRQSERVAYNVALFVPVFGGIALSTGFRWIAGVRSAAWRTPAFVAAGVAVVLVLAWPAARHNRELVEIHYEAYGPLRDADLAAFEYLAGRVGPGDTVLNDGNVDGSLWMYAFEGVVPMYGLGATSDVSFAADRSYLREHVTEVGSDPRVAELVEGYGVRYVYFGERTYPGSDHVMDLGALERAPGLRPVFEEDGVHVFEVEPGHAVE